MNRIEYNVKRLLHERGLSQNQLADRAGIDRGNLSRTVRGRVPPGMATLQTLADSLQADISEILQPIPENNQNRGCQHIQHVT